MRIRVYHDGDPSSGGGAYDVRRIEIVLTNTVITTFVIEDCGDDYLRVTPGDDGDNVAARTMLLSPRPGIVGRSMILHAEKRR